tara:strand:- start:1803 stop:3059 length:1257 start_codon:yes stop_codon:yes gene_type:complete
MSTIFAFGPDDIVRNVVKSNPSARFYIYQDVVYFQNRPELSGAFTGSVPNVPPGHISLYEYNVDRDNPDDLSAPLGMRRIRPEVTKDGYLTSLKTVTTGAFNSALYGTSFLGFYPKSATISREYFPLNHGSQYFTNSLTTNKTGQRNRIVALKNTLNHYSYLSPHYSVRGSVPPLIWAKEIQVSNLISIPSIFYGSSIEKGTVELDFFVSGTLAGRLKDVNKNGELIQVSGAANELRPALHGSGAVAGVVLYNEGFILLTGSWDLDPDHTEPYLGGTESPKWVYYGTGAETASLGRNIPSSSFALRFSGSTETSVMTMFAHAVAGELNHSNNPTYIQFSQSLDPFSGSTYYKEPEKLIIKNTISGAFTDLTESFQKQTFVSKVKIYDEDMNCIGVAKVSTPINKKLSRDMTFKLKLDI